MSIQFIAFVCLILVVIIVIVSLLLFRRSGKKKQANATASSDWQRQGQQQQVSPPGWNQQGNMQGTNSWNQAGQQANAWGAQQQPSGWDAQNPAQQQSAAGWGAPSQTPQQQAPGWGQAPAQQQAAGWGTPSQAPQQPATWNAAGTSGAEAQQPWNAQPPTYDPWAQPQQGDAQWGQQSNQPAAPTSYGNNSGSGQSWPQSAQVADQWGQPAQQAQQGNWAPSAQQAPPTTPPGGTVPWQQPVPGQVQQGFGASPFDNPDGDKTMLRSTGGSQSSGQAPLRDLTHEHLQFTVFHPRVVPTATWRTLLVYAYIESVVQAIRADVAKFEDELGPVPGEEFVWAPHPISRNMQITIIPTCPGITFNPPSFSFKWIEDWYRATFRFQADAKLAGSVCNGEIVIRADPLIIATLKLSLRLVEQRPIPTTAEISNTAEESTDLYKQIFASYSHSDTSIVLACRNAYTALGLDYLIDIDKLRSGQRWDIALLKMIDTADIFQLFWSANAARSGNVQREWQYALQHSKYGGFIRPVYWEKPLIPPPSELSHMHFAYVELPKLETTGAIGCIRIEVGRDAGRMYEIRKESLSIGRSRESHIFLEDLAVSRLHASILNLGNSNYALRDEGSANGTKLNGQPVNKYQPYPLQEGDKIQLGQTELIFFKR